MYKCKLVLIDESIDMSLWIIYKYYVLKDVT